MRIFFGILGAVMLGAGLFFSIGAVEVATGGGTTEEIAQGFLAVGTLVLLGGLALWVAIKGVKRDGAAHLGDD